MSDLPSIPVGEPFLPVGQAFGEAIPSEPACQNNVPSNYASCHDHFLNERRTLEKPIEKIFLVHKHSLTP
jgi:hypothetical protein